MLKRTLGFGLIGILTATGAWGQEIITRNTTLDHDVTTGIIIATDGVTLNCAGHQVTNNLAPFDGISVVSRTRVTVRRCNVTGNSGSGFLIENTRDSTFEANSVRENVKGFNIFGVEGTTFIRNVVRRNVEEGFQISSITPEQAVAVGGFLGCDGNFFFENIVFNNGGHGFAMEGTLQPLQCKHNVFVDNQVNLNSGDGFSLFRTERTYFSRNFANGNSGIGFNLLADDRQNTFVRNAAFDNGVLDAKADDLSCENTFQENRFGRSELAGTSLCR